MKIEQIVETMGKTDFPVISFVGAGGKTSCMLELANNLAAQGKKVLVTTTTHMEHPLNLDKPGCVDASAEEILEQLNKNGFVIAGSRAEQPGKIKGLPVSVWEQVKKKADVILVEADGAKRFPLKVSGKQEPVIPKEYTHILVMAGAGSIGKSLEESCFRLQEAEGILAVTEQSPADIKRLRITEERMGILIEKGYVEPLKSRYPTAKIAVILNQADILLTPQECASALQQQVSVPVFLHGWEKEIHGIYLAAGFSRRFKGNKLLEKLEGKPMYLHLLERLNEMRENHKLQSLTVVTQYEEILDYLHREGIAAVKNNNSALGISSSLKLGLQTAMMQKKQHLEREQYYIFFVADQPFLKKNTVEEFVSAFLKTDRGIGCISHDGKAGNPVIFHERYVPELLKIEGDKGGKSVVNQHFEDVFLFEIPDEIELKDIDRRM